MYDSIAAQGLRQGDNPMSQSKYAPSLFDTEDGHCYICGRYDLTARHEIFRGTNRQNSKRTGLWINVCDICHRNLHKRDNELEMCRRGQRRYERTHTRDEFIQIFGKDYL